MEFGAALPPLVGKVSNIHALHTRREAKEDAERENNWHLTAFISSQVWRIGIMGYNSTEWHTNKALSVFKDGLLHIGYTPKATKMKAEL